ncbi:hypothetical protein C8J57DRAFT_1721720 [Mycena rebaudengoi]|nr:hypothetical protein C8J57DRAFT_1721720 [Mycena rebaudengoi]
MRAVFPPPQPCPAPRLLGHISRQAPCAAAVTHAYVVCRARQADGIIVLLEGHAWHLAPPRTPRARSTDIPTSSHFEALCARVRTEGASIDTAGPGGLSTRMFVKDVSKLVDGVVLGTAVYWVVWAARRSTRAAPPCFVFRARRKAGFDDAMRDLAGGYLRSYVMCDIYGLCSLHDELFYAIFPDAQPSRCSARAEQEHAQMFGLGLLPMLCPPGEHNGGMVLVLSYGAETYAYADPDVYGYSAAAAYMEPTRPSPYATIAADAYAYAYPPPPPPPPRLITDVWSLAHAVTPSVSPAQPPPLSSVSSVSTSSSSSKRRYSVFASESPPEPTSVTTRDPRRRRSEHATPSACSSRERSSESEPAPITTTTITERAQQESKGGEPPKKPLLACLFCRGRKIACGPPVGGSVESVGSCNQCQRRGLKCEYPAESRRGMRKKKGVVVGSSTTSLAGVGGSSTALAGGSAGGSRVKHEHEHQFEVNGVFETGDVKPLMARIKTEASSTPPSASSGMKIKTEPEAWMEDVGMPSPPSSSSPSAMSSLSLPGSSSSLSMRGSLSPMASLGLLEPADAFRFHAGVLHAHAQQHLHSHLQQQQQQCHLQHGEQRTQQQHELFPAEPYGGFDVYADPIPSIPDAVMGDTAMGAFGGYVTGEPYVSESYSGAGAYPLGGAMGMDGKRALSSGSPSSFGGEAEGEALWLFGKSSALMAAEPQDAQTACLELSPHLSTGPQTFASGPMEHTDAVQETRKSATPGYQKYYMGCCFVVVIG